MEERINSPLSASHGQERHGNPNLDLLQRRIFQLNQNLSNETFKASCLQEASLEVERFGKITHKKLVYG